MSAIKPTPSTKAVLGIDIGGTKINWNVFKIIDGKISDTKLAGGSEPTSEAKGLDNLKKKFKEICDKAAAECSESAEIIATGTAAPGRYIGANIDEIAPGSAANLEREGYAGELDGVKLVEEFKRIAPESVGQNVYLTNDALAQMAALLNPMLSDPNKKAQFMNKTVAYIGPGTGLGGGFAQVDKEGNSRLITDGHIYDVMLELDEADMDIVQEKIAAGVEIYIKDGKVRAEDVISGTAIEKLTGVTSSKHLDDDISLRNEHEDMLKLVGRATAKLIEVIHEGDFGKVRRDDNWPAEDLEAIKGTKDYIIGGGVGQSKNVGKIILEETQLKLDEKGIDNINIIAEQDAEVTKAAASIIPADILGRGASRV